MISTSLSYQRISGDMDKSLSRVSSDRIVTRETNYYLANIGTIKSIDDFFDNDRVYNYAMKAFGLEDMAYAKGLIRKVLEEGVSDPKSFANRMSDDRFVELATVFNFTENGETTTAAKEAQQGVVDLYTRQTLEERAGDDNEGVRLALYFERAAPEVKSAYGLLADDALWAVIKTTFGFPAEMANADIEKQAKAVEQRMDIADLQDPEKLAKLIQRFTIMWDATENVTADPILNLFSNSRSTSVSADLLLTLNQLKHGGT
ncbi:DUF1217 domain-containing protein [Afifella marina]|uniref:Flagellar basal-body rod protein FlgF n=1 Tax=Afifella marina DSM 2698 TaxID=1120955 RepID=A0A1G5MVL1_AFIMA|nr:DUF1217 domain-containing protein [Afifella marina]MBK1622027.1 DUF1217 domain-containing protein [Afifella marina DSM 2698]MBK1627820.1 DUF1217 domain-containing protein [Afifella marina]MBK5916787.1 flagellar biosynthesis protein FlgF [Afifella marina]RAI19887.1 flagellar biosynthesis protein FlgF [Afifella marina DSM 2698]SCZ28874.1 Protein of unknown function [Afifella marina DSM 2698]